MASVVIALTVSSCSGKKTDSDPSSAFLEGTYRMTSTQTIAADTTFYPGGDKIISTAETNTGSNFSGTLTITKGNMQLNGFSYTINQTGETKTLTISTNQTTLQPYSATINNVTAPGVASTYTLSADKDTVTIQNYLDIVQSRYNNPGKYKVVVSGNTVTFSNNYYLNIAAGVYITKKRLITTTVYQKQ